MIKFRKKKADKDIDKRSDVKQHKIEIVNVNKIYDMGRESLHVLKDINFTVDEGEYYLDGLAIHSMKEKKLTSIRNEKIGFIFQNYHLIPTYTVIQNVIMPLLMRGYEHEEAQEMCMDTIEMLGLKERINHKPNELSGGQKQRVAIARALVGEPAILLADEPTGALDSKSGKEVLKLFRKLNDMGNTIVMITHDLKVAKAAKRVVKIVDGEIFAVEN